MKQTWVETEGFIRNNPVKYTDPDGRSSGFKENVQAVGNWFKENHEALGTIGTGLAMVVGGNFLKGAGIGGGLTLAPVTGGASIVAGSAAYVAGQALEVGGALTVAAGLAMLATADGMTSHGQQRQQEGRDGDPNRNVGDTNKIKSDGNRFIDSETGNNVYVKGNKVYIENQDGQAVSQFHNSNANTLSRIESGKWIPVE